METKTSREITNHADYVSPQSSAAPSLAEKSLLADQVVPIWFHLKMETPNTRQWSRGKQGEHDGIWL